MIEQAETRTGTGLRERLRRIVEDRRFQSGIIWLILANAAILGLETSPAAMDLAGPVLLAVDQVILAIFVAEIAMRLLVHGPRFFRDPWSVFDFAVVAISLLPAAGAFNVLRALRVLRVLRLFSVVPSMRRVVGGLLSAVPGLGAIMAIMGIIFYVGAVIATKLFAASFPDWFGDLALSAYTLFQIMTLESWSMGIVRPVMEVYPFAWAFFVPFILVATFTMLNLFIAVIVNAMQREHDAENAEAAAEVEEAARFERQALQGELRGLRADVAELRRLLENRPRPS